MNRTGSLLHKIVDGLGPESKPGKMLCAWNRRHVGHGSIKNRPRRRFVAQIRSEFGLGNLGKLALDTGVIIAATIQDNSVKLLVTSQFPQKGQDVCLHVIVGGIHEYRSMDAFMETALWSILCIVHGSPFRRNVTRKDGSLALQSVIAAIATDEGIDCRMHTEPGGMTGVQECLKIIEGGGTFHKSVTSSHPGGKPLRMRGHGRVPKNRPFRWTDIHDNVRETTVRHFLHFLGNIGFV